MDPSRRFQLFNMDKNTFPPPPNTSSVNAIADFSRKSNFMMSGQPSHPPTAMLGCGFPSGRNDKFNGLCCNNIVNGNAFNQPEEPLNLRYTTENGYWDPSDLAAPWQPRETSGNSIYTSSLGQLQSVQWEETSLPKVSTLLPLLRGHTNQLKTYASNEITEKSHTEGQVQDFPRHGQSGHLNSDFNSSGEIPNPSSILPLLVENLQNRSLDPRMPSVNVEGQACFQESSNIQAQSGASRGLDSSNISAVVRQLPEFYKEHVNDIFVQNQPQISSCCAGSFSTNNSVKGFSSAASRLIQPGKEKTSAKKAKTDPSICGNVLKTEDPTSSINTDQIVACKARERLWNGTLQLSSSVQSSVAAYFRSGDKMPDLYWTDSIEVKGKVRLEAFEKYIQDLPRSRSRGLMVMSLCLKEGSSGDGLKAMYEVIEKYKTGKRVGRAQVSPGVDVYICPNTETIISILAMNGFSMGSVSVQDLQDSLIGCAVWRKDSSSEPGSRKLSQSLLGQPSISSPNSNPQKVNGSDPSSAKTEVEVEAIQQASIEAPVTNGVPGNSSGESKNAESTNDAHTIQNIVKQLTAIEASIFRSLGIEKNQGSLQLLSTILPSSSEVAVKQPEPITEDDDLPEYDFSSAVSHASTTSNSLHAVAMEKLANGEFRPNNELVEPSQIRVESQGDVDGGALPQKRKMADSSVEEKANMTSMQSKGNTGKLLGSKIRNLFDEDDMPEWQPPDMKHFKGSTNLTTRPPPFVPNTFRPPPYFQMPLPPPPKQPPGPPQFRPAGRPQHRPYNTNEPANHNRWSRH
ncbi:hypothetical protein V2J09_021144 [Rumex salicifolius]